MSSRSGNRHTRNDVETEHSGSDFSATQSYHDTTDDEGSDYDIVLDDSSDGDDIGENETNHTKNKSTKLSASSSNTKLKSNVSNHTQISHTTKNTVKRRTSSVSKQSKSQPSITKQTSKRSRNSDASLQTLSKKPHPKRIQRRDTISTVDSDLDSSNESHSESDSQDNYSDFDMNDTATQVRNSKKSKRAQTNKRPSSTSTKSAISTSTSAVHNRSPEKKKNAKIQPSSDPNDIDTVLSTLREHVRQSAFNSASAAKTLRELGYTNVTEVQELNPTTVMRRIEDVIVHVAENIMRGEAFEYHIPNRGASNQLFIEELDRIVLLDKVSTRSFLSTSSIRKTVIMTRVMQLVHEVLRRNIHTTKRDLFYTDVKLFRQQNDSDAVLDDVACLAGCTRTSLHVVASEKGVVVGRLQFREDGDEINCARMGVGGKAIPPYIDRISDIRSDAEFILLVEKDAAFMRLAEDRFYNKYPCIILTAKGQPDVATRLFLKLLKTELNLPVLGLVDSDPYGLKILSVYMSGSKNMSYDSASLTTPDIKWLGVRPSDLDRYNIPEQCRLKMTDTDIKTGKDMLNEDFIQKNPQWHSELQMMIKKKEKAEIQSLSAYGFQYLTEVYLPAKLKEGDWI